MEIKSDIKYKVLGQYFGQKAQLIRDDSKDIYVGEHPELKNRHNNSSVESYKLILKPLSVITDEDAIEVAKILYKDGDDYRISFNNGDIITIAPFGLPHYGDEIDIHPKSNHFFADRGVPNGQYLAYQYLISKGYDLPNYHLDGKTLQESGLAIYEN